MEIKQQRFAKECGETDDAECPNHGKERRGFVVYLGEACG